jgi:hypothetical protein
MSKPSEFPRWNDVQAGNAAYNVHPLAAKQDTGWAVAEKPAAQHANWLFQLIYQWLVWLAGQVARTYHIAGSSGKQHLGHTWTSGFDDNWFPDQTGFMQHLAGATGPVVWTLDQLADNDLFNVTVQLQSDAGVLGDFTCDLRRVNLDGTGDVSINLVNSAAVLTPQTVNLTPLQLSATNLARYYVRVTPSGAGIIGRVFEVNLILDRG